MTSKDLQVRARRAARFWKPLEVAALCVALVAWFGYIGLWVYYDATRPTRQDGNTGRVYRLDTLGSIVYLNRSEESTMTVLMWAAGVSAVMAACADVYAKPFRKTAS